MLTHASTGRLVRYGHGNAVVTDHSAACGIWLENARDAATPLTCLWCVAGRRRFG